MLDFAKHRNLRMDILHHCNLLCKPELSILKLLLQCLVPLFSLLHCRRNFLRLVLQLLKNVLNSSVMLLPEWPLHLSECFTQSILAPQSPNYKYITSNTVCPQHLLVEARTELAAHALAASAV